MMSRQPLWISHRGLHAQASENSLAAFHGAVAAGFDGLETDLRTTTDWRIILCHDPSLDRVAGQDIFIEHSHSRDLSDLRLKDGQPLLSFEQFLEAFPSVLWTFDVKPEGALATIAALKRLCENKGLERKLRDKARFLFWRQDHRQIFQKTFPGMSIVAMEPECYRAGLSVLCKVPFAGGIKAGLTYALPPRFAGVALYRAAFVRQYQKRDARVVAYLPRTPEQFSAAVAAGVDEILSDGYIQKS